MSLLTAQARSSVFEVPGLMLCPFPTGTIGAADRVQISDLYAGLQVAPPLTSNQTSWVSESQGTDVWVPEQQGTDTWVPEQQGTDVWIPEQNVTPYQV